MSLDDDLAAGRSLTPEERERARLESRLAETRRERDSARHALRAAEKEGAALADRLMLTESIAEMQPKAPKWLAPKPKAAGRRATVNVMLSDLHLDEVVNPDEIGGVNAYDRDIATIRLRTTFEKVVELSRDYLAGVTYDGIVANLGGDVFTGTLHDLAQFNDGVGNLDSILYWIEHLAAGIDMLADEFGKVHVPVVPGNHGRLTLKPRTKGRSRDNIDWFVGALLAREFHDDQRVTFAMSDSADVRYDIYDTRFLLTHGDQASGGGGIGGIWPPLKRFNAKRMAQKQATGDPYDVLVMGHFHQLVYGGDFIVNGSLVGMSEYSYLGAFPYEPPRQAFWTVAPDKGITFTAPILPQNRKREKW